MKTKNYECEFSEVKETGKSNFAHDPDYDFPRGEDAEDMAFLVKVVLVITGALVGFVAGLFYWVF